MIVERYNPPKAVRPTSYSQATRAGNTLYVAGQVAWDEKGKAVGLGDIAAQAEQTFQNVQEMLELAGGGLKDVVKLTAFITNPLYTPTVRDVCLRYFPKEPPALTVLGINALASPELLIEVEAVAVLSPQNRRVFNLPDARGQRPGYSGAAKGDDTLYVSGQVAWNEKRETVGGGDISAQAEQIFTNLTEVLSLAPAKLQDIAMIRNFMVNPVLFSPFWEVYCRYIQQRYPANTTIIVNSLAFPDLLLETEAVVPLSGGVEFIEPSWRGKPKEYSMCAKAGNTLYISGQLSRNREGNIVGRGDIAAQVDQAFQNMGIVLAEVGASYKDVVKLTAFVTSPAFFSSWGEVRGRYFPKDPPASTAVAIPALARPDFLIEVEAIAVVS